jgi:hypothetical protein
MSADVQQQTAVAKAPRGGRNETVEHAVVTIFAKIDDPRSRIDTSRFMIEATHGFQGNRVDQAGRIGRNFEHPAMIFSETFAETLARARRCFFTGQPTSPWRDAA